MQTDRSFKDAAWLGFFTAHVSQRYGTWRQSPPLFKWYTPLPMQWRREPGLKCVHSLPGWILQKGATAGLLNRTFGRKIGDCEKITRAVRKRILDAENPEDAAGTTLRYVAGMVAIMTQMLWSNNKITDFGSIRWITGDSYKRELLWEICTWPDL